MIRLFRVRGIPVRAEPAWLVVVALFAWSLASGYFPRVLPDRSALAYWTQGMLASLLLFGCVLVHELSHALVATVHGVAVRGITLHVFGGVSQLDTEPATPRAEFLIAVVGPLTSFALAALCWAVTAALPGPPAALAISGYLVAVNLVVGTFNLIPGFPLDGGRMLRAGVWWWSGALGRATSVAARTGAVFGLALVVVGVYRVARGDLVGGVWLTLIGIFLRQAALASGELARIRARLEPVSVTAVMSPAADDVDPAESVRPRQSAWDAFLAIARTRGGRIAVREDDAVVGVVTREAVQRALTGSPEEPAERRAA